MNGWIKLTHAAHEMRVAQVIAFVRLEAALEIGPAKGRRAKSRHRDPALDGHNIEQSANCFLDPLVLGKRRHDLDAPFIKRDADGAVSDVLEQSLVKSPRHPVQHEMLLL